MSSALRPLTTSWMSHDVDLSVCSSYVAFVLQPATRAKQKDRACPKTWSILVWLLQAEYPDMLDVICITSCP